MWFAFTFRSINMHKKQHITRLHGKFHVESFTELRFHFTDAGREHFTDCAVWISVRPNVAQTLRWEYLHSQSCTVNCNIIIRVGVMIMTLMRSSVQNYPERISLHPLDAEKTMQDVVGTRGLRRRLPGLHGD